MREAFKRIAGAVSMASIILGGQATLAQDIAIVNPSFEDPVVGAGGETIGVAGSTTAITGWDISGNGEAGVWNPSGIYTGILGPVPDGDQVGTINGDGGTSVSQTLNTDLLPYTTYTLSAWVGGRTDGGGQGGIFDVGTDYSISLYGGANLLASVTPVDPPAGSWIYLNTTYTTGASVPAATALGISIFTQATQLDYDDVNLTSSIFSPEPENLTLIGGLVLMGFLRFVRARN